MQIKIKSFNKKYIHIASYKILSKLLNIYGNLEYSMISLPIKKKYFTFIKSPHVFNKSREAFEFRYYTKIISLKNIKIDSKFIYTIRMITPPGVNIKFNLIN